MAKSKQSRTLSAKPRIGAQRRRTTRATDTVTADFEPEEIRTDPDEAAEAASARQDAPGAQCTGSASPAEPVAPPSPPAGGIGPQPPNPAWSHQTGDPNPYQDGQRVAAAKDDFRARAEAAARRTGRLNAQAIGLLGALARQRCSELELTANRLEREAATGKSSAADLSRALAELRVIALETIRQSETLALEIGWRLNPAPIEPGVRPPVARPPVAAEWADEDHQ